MALFGGKQSNDESSGRKRRLLGRKKTTDEVIDEPVEEPSLPTAPEPNEAGLRTVADHRDYLLSLVEPLPPFGMALLDAWGLALCEDIRSETDLPPFDNCHVDGYAVRAEDVASASQGQPLQLAVIGRGRAGEAAPDLAPGRAIKVTAGTPLPRGANAVLPNAFTDRGNSRVKVLEPVSIGEYVRGQASDVHDGDLLMSRGQVLDARHIGLLAAAGIDKVIARPRPRVVVVSSGAELTEPGRPLGEGGQIYDANSFMVAAAAKAAGCQVWRVPVFSDDPQAIREAISDQLIRADLIISTGGVNTGEFDQMQQVMPQMGLCDFAEVAMQPGMPQGFGLIGDDEVPMIMLPGNPVSAYVGFHAFVRPVIRKLMGVEPVDHEAVRVVAGSIMRSVKGKLQFGRAIVTNDNGRRLVHLVGDHSSHLLGELGQANALVLLGEDVEVVTAGEPVMVWMLDND